MRRSIFPASILLLACVASVSSAAGAGFIQDVVRQYLDNIHITANGIYSPASGGDIFSTGAVAFAAEQSMGGYKLTNLGAPTVGGDAANKTYADTKVASSATIAADHGGTGQTSYAVGDLIYASTTTALSKLADVAVNRVLTSGGVGVAPAYAAFAGDATGAITSFTITGIQGKNVSSTPPTNGQGLIWSAATDQYIPTTLANPALSSVLATANTTGAYDISVNTGQKISGAAELQLTATTGLATLQTTAAQSIILKTFATTRWEIDLSGHLLAGSDGTYDIGSPDAGSSYLRPRDVFVKNSVKVQTSSTSTTYGYSSIVSGAFTINASGSNELTLQTNSATALTISSAGVVYTPSAKKFSIGAGATPTYLLDVKDAITTGNQPAGIGIVARTSEASPRIVSMGFGGGNDCFAGTLSNHVYEIIVNNAVIGTWDSGGLVLGGSKIFSLNATQLIAGTGTPEASISAPVASVFHRTDGAPGTTLYMKGTGASNTGWVPVPAGETSARSTAQTSANASVTAVTVGAADASYVISGNVNVTAAAAASFGLACDYTDETNTARTLTIPFSNLSGTSLTAITTTGPYEGLSLRIRCKAATTITLYTTGTFTSVTYNVEGAIRLVRTS